MIRKLSKNVHRQRVHRRLRRKISGTAERPRLAVFRSLKHIYAQVIDDKLGRTVAAASTMEKDAPAKGCNLGAAKAIGKLVAERAQEQGIKAVVFDRGGYRYHGRMKALADAAREAGLEF
jgi:large subunit ribosomal protein L18